MTSVFDEDEEESWSIFLEIASKKPAELLRYCRDNLTPTLERSKELVRLPGYELNETNALARITQLEGLVEIAITFLDKCADALEDR